MNRQKRKVVEKYMRQYNELINSTINKNNAEIYRNLHAFLAPHKEGKVAPVDFEKNTKGLTI